MTLTRVTQSMMLRGSHTALQQALGRLAQTQEQLSTGRILNRPSDSPADVTTAMRLRGALSDQDQFLRNVEDGRGWLTQIDSALQASIDHTRRARELALQGASAGAAGQQARESLAAEVDQLRAGLVALGNATYLDRPVFGGITGGRVAFDPDGTYVGTPGAVTRTVAEGIRIQVNIDPAAVFGVSGPGTTTVFQDLDALATALRAGDTDQIRAGIEKLGGVLDRMTTAIADVGSRAARIEQAGQAAEDAQLALTTNLTSLEQTDLPRAIVDLQMQETAYQAALAATARVMQPSLLDFLR
ncbi:flagellar hook-associated protein 3 FlgL [Nocardioides massiliensis]|uniref:Flagellin n=3 Tax=Nocardioides massiliensis TaxID=1325935 RepID=A0ABT9NMS5_9ACTN|nr:flagellin [Nocardioides massiliensis]MDP9821725.1 flagellar hook-associated protein 3 FlgL [Nocardioides massiliensis]